MEHYEEAIEKMTQHIAEKDEEFEATLAEGEALLKMEKDRADGIWKQLEKLKTGEGDEEAVDRALSTHRNTITKMEGKLHDTMKKEVAKQVDANKGAASEMKKMEKGLKEVAEEVGRRVKMEVEEEESDEEVEIVVVKKKKKKKVVVIEESEEEVARGGGGTGVRHCRSRHGLRRRKSQIRR